MRKEEVFALLEDVSQDKLCELEQKGFLTVNLTYGDDGSVEEEYALTDAGVKHYDLETDMGSENYF